MESYKVYIHKFPNGKVYIGITMRDAEKRWGNGSGYRMQPRIFNAIMKYGWDNIEHIVLFEGLTKEDAEEKEVALIRLYDSTNRNKGYNIENGGNSIGKHSDLVKAKISESTKKQWQRKEYRQLMSSVHKGKVVSKETKEKMSKSKIGKHMGAENHNSRAVVQYTKEGVFVAIFDSAKTAQRKTGANNAKICECCKGSRKTCGGFRWEYADK